VIAEILHDGARTDLSGCKVLVVDDALGIRKIIGAYLQAAGISLIDYAVDGVEGLAKVASFEPDLVILDIMMPEMDGFELCRTLRANPAHKHLPILVETALESPSERTDVFRAGASDVITKPIHGPELIARVRLQLENRLMIRSLQDYQQRMQQELKLAQAMQLSLLPQDSHLGCTTQYPGIRVQSLFRPSAALGGDFWLSRELEPGVVAFAIVDFSGHGVAAALNTFRLHTLMHQLPPPSPLDPAGYLQLLNTQLVDLLPSGQFATMFLCVVDQNKDSLIWAGAAAPSPIIGTADGLRFLDASGVPLGITHKAKYINSTEPFPAGSFLLMYSDALVETPDDQGEELEGEALMELTRLAQTVENGQSPLTSLLASAMEGRETPTDDLTVVWFSRV